MHFFNQTTVKDNRWQDVATFPAGALLGKLKGDYEHQYNGITYILYRDNVGVRFVKCVMFASSKSTVWRCFGMILFVHMLEKLYFCA